MGDIRQLAKTIKANHELGLELWETGNLDARLLAILLIDPKQLSSKELERMVRSATFAWLADWLNSYVVKQHPDEEALRVKWMKAKNPWLARAGWSLSAERVARSPEGLDLPALLAQIGIAFPAHRKRALGIGEQLGLYRDDPVSKGCTSPFAPIWIAAMVGRKA